MSISRRGHVSRRRLRRILAVGVGGAVGVTGFLVPVSASAAPRVSATAGDTPADDGLPEEERALAAAQASGQPAEVVSARTESSDEWANPDGTFSVKRYGTPVRVFRDGAWVATDSTLVFAADGSVVPKASTVSVVFSGGGDGLLLKGVRDGRTLTLGWPKTLPKPTLAENVATYANVLPDVDMKLKAEVDGFSQLLVVKTPEAAKNPELETVKYSLQASGLTVSKDADTGVISAVDPAGQAVFSSPPPVMWDSTALSSDGAQVKSGLTAPASASGFDQPAGAKSSLMPASLSGSTLSIVPDQTLLGASDTKYPVFIDPLWSGAAYSERQHWTRVYKKWPTNSYYDAKDVARVGFEHETDGVSRSFFQMDTAKLKGAKVVESTFRIKNVWSWSCQARPVQLWETGPISRKTNWNNQPARVGSAPLKTVDESKGWSSSSCPAGNLEFDVTPKMKTVAEQGRASITLGLSATAEDEKGDQPEEDTFSWKKFDPKTAVLETKFNRAPEKPDQLGTFPYTSCKAGSSVGNTHVSLHARVRQDDAGPLRARFTVKPAAGGDPVFDESVDATNWSVATTRAIPDADLPTGTYTWSVTATDKQGAPSPASPTCTFSVDRSRPEAPPLISSVEFPNGKAGWDRAHTGKAKEPGCFTFDPNGVKDVDSIWWWTDTNPSPQKAAVGACKAGVASAIIKPPSYGSHFVHAYSVDAAGNQSTPNSYLYYANSRGERDLPGDLNGDGNNDIWSVDSNGTLLTHTGQGNGQFSAAASGGKSFSNAQITYRGGWRQNSATDLVSLEYDPAQKHKRLWVYANDGDGMLQQSGLGEAALGRELTVACPEVDETLDCYTADDHWKDADQIVAAGDLNRDKVTELLVKEGKLLYLYRGDTNLDLSRKGGPVAVGGTDWDKYTVIAPGDTNGDGLPDLWLREIATGDLFVSFGQPTADSQPGDEKLDLSRWGSLAPQYSAKIGSGYTTARYPVLSSIGDLTGDKDGKANPVPDLWARQADNTMVGWAGKLSGSAVAGFGSSFTIDGSTGGIRIPAGTVITEGQSFKSRSAKLTFTTGTLSVTSNAGKTLWSSPSGGAGATAVMQTDGTLAIHKADGTLGWTASSGTANGYALLQDRGNLVVYNSVGQAQWSSGTALQHDYDGDGHDDLADWYDFGDGHDGMHTFLSSSDGSFTTAPKPSAIGGDWFAGNMKFATGDYNGDGRADMAALYGYSDGSVKLFTALGQEGGGFSQPTASWGSPAGHWAFANMTVRSGDFNGDGRDDLTVWYSYGDGSDRLFTFTADIRGGFNAPLASYYAPAGNYDVRNMQFTTGDFDGDGRSDLGVLYGYSDGHVQMHSFLAREDGGFNDRTASWQATNFQFARTHIVAGDFNGDGKDDIAAWYDQADGGDALHTFVSNATADGKFDNPKVGWQAPAGGYYYPNMKIVAGDYDGDGRDDIGAMYGFDNGTVKMLTWRSTGSGFNNPLPGWSTATGWTFDRVHLLNNFS